jgi:hypothetical protein
MALPRMGKMDSQFNALMAMIQARDTLRAL